MLFIVFYYIQIDRYDDTGSHQSSSANISLATQPISKSFYAKNSFISCKYGKTRIYRNVENYGRIVINLIIASSAHLNDERIRKKKKHYHGN